MTSLRMLTVCPFWIGVGRLAGSVSRKALPQLDELQGKLGVIQLAQPFTGYHHDIPASQASLVMAKGLADLALQTVAFNRELDALFADHQTQSGVIQIIVASQKQDMLARDLAGR